MKLNNVEVSTHYWEIIKYGHSPILSPMMYHQYSPFIIQGHVNTYSPYFYDKRNNICFVPEILLYG